MISFVLRFLLKNLGYTTLTRDELVLERARSRIALEELTTRLQRAEESFCLEREGFVREREEAARQKEAAAQEAAQQKEVAETWRTQIASLTYSVNELTADLGNERLAHAAALKKLEAQSVLLDEARREFEAERGSLFIRIQQLMTDACATQRVIDDLERALDEERTRHQSQAADLERLEAALEELRRNYEDALRELAADKRDFVRAQGRRGGDAADDDLRNILVCALPFTQFNALAEAVVPVRRARAVVAGRNLFPNDLLDERELIGPGVAVPWICAGHADASPHNLNILGKSSARVLVYVADPRQILVNRATAEGAFDGISPSVPEGFEGLSPGQRIDWLIEAFLPHLVTWVEGWLAVVEARPNRPFLVVTEERLADAETRREVAEFLGVGPDILPKIPGRAASWSEIMSPIQKTLAGRRIGARLADRFGWA